MSPSDSAVTLQCALDTDGQSAKIEEKISFPVQEACRGRHSRVDRSPRLCLGPDRVVSLKHPVSKIAVSALNPVLKSFPPCNIFFSYSRGQLELS
jgi:hypothetical protein